MCYNILEYFSYQMTLYYYVFDLCTFFILVALLLNNLRISILLIMLLRFADRLHLWLSNVYLHVSALTQTIRQLILSCVCYQCGCLCKPKAKCQCGYIEESVYFYITVMSFNHVFVSVFCSFCIMLVLFPEHNNVSVFHKLMV